MLQKFTPHPSLMREQLLRLLDVSDFANVSLQVMPLDSEPHPGARGNFSIFHFPKPWPSLVSAESAGVNHCTEGQEAAERFQTDFDRIVASALPADRHPTQAADWAAASPSSTPSVPTVPNCDSPKPTTEPDWDAFKEGILPGLL